MLDRKDIPTAIFAADDTMAITALNVIKSRGYNVPEDISLVGFNNSPEATVVTPALTTVDQNIYSLGYEAGNILISPERYDELKELENTGEKMPIYKIPEGKFFIIKQ